MLSRVWQVAAFTRSPDSSVSLPQRVKGRTRKDAGARTASSAMGEDTDREEEEEVAATPLGPRAPAEQTLTNQESTELVGGKKRGKCEVDTFIILHPATHIEIKSLRCCVSNCHSVQRVGAFSSCTLI